MQPWNKESGVGWRTYFAILSWIFLNKKKKQISHEIYRSIWEFINLLPFPLLRFLFSPLRIIALCGLFAIHNRSLVGPQGFETEFDTNLVRLFQTDTLFHRHLVKADVGVDVKARWSDLSRCDTAHTLPFPNIDLQKELFFTSRRMASLLGPFRRTYRYLVGLFTISSSKTLWNSLRPATPSSRESCHFLLLCDRLNWTYHGDNCASYSWKDGV